LHADVWHTLLLEHVWPDAHVPQVSVAPQPSGMLPQVFPCAAHVVGTHDAWQVLLLPHV
jgi:hypothetical protein